MCENCEEFQQKFNQELAIKQEQIDQLRQQLEDERNERIKLQQVSLFPITNLLK